MEFKWNDKVDGVDYCNAEDVNLLGHAVETLNNEKVTKEEGKGLSQENFTSEEKQKVAGLDNYDDTELRELINELIQTKLDKKTNATDEAQAYLKNRQGGLTMANVTTTPYAWTIPYRDDNGNITVGTNASKYSNSSAVSKKFVLDKIAELVDGSPELLDTFNEFAKALDNDPNFAATIASELAKKANATDVEASLDNKVDKVNGKGLSTNDFSNDEKTLLSNLGKFAGEIGYVVAVNKTPDANGVNHVIKRNEFGMFFLMSKGATVTYTGNGETVSKSGKAHVFINTKDESGNHMMYHIFYGTTILGMDVLNYTLGSDITIKSNNSTSERLVRIPMKSPSTGF